MKRQLVVAAALGIAVLAAAFVRPPRATPAFKEFMMAPTPAPEMALERGSRFAAATSRDSRHHARGHKARARSNGRTRHRAKPKIVVDINHADAATLAQVPGISEDLAQRIVAYRALVGPFATLDDLADLDGLSESRLNTLGRYLVAR